MSSVCSSYFSVFALTLDLTNLSETQDSLRFVAILKLRQFVSLIRLVFIFM